MLKIAICDDEAFMLDALSSKILDYADQKQLSFQISRFSNSRDLLENKAAFDVLFLDIQMAPPDGMAAARQLRMQGFTGLLIFTTVLKEAVFDSFAVQAFDFLVKPIEDRRFEQTMDRAMLALKSQSSKTLVVQKQSEYQVIPFSQILYCEVIGRKIYLHKAETEVIDYYEKMGKLIEQLDSRFYLCHRSYLVNLDHVRSCKNGRVMLSNGGEVPVSRLREKELIQALLMRMKEGRR